MIRKFLLIDDDPDDQFFFSEALHQVNADIVFTSAMDGVDALEQLKDMETLPDIIFLDNNMPRMNGLECLIELKKDNRYAAIPVILYSTSSSPDFQVQCKNEGASAYLQKPDDFEDLIRVLSEWVV